MSEPLYEVASLRFWNENELNLRDMIVNRLIFKLKENLLDVNKSWTFHRIEAPVLIPNKYVSNSYTESDLFVTNHIFSNEPLCLRPETTKGSYLYAVKHNLKLPVCVYQLGKSFRRELNDGASAKKLRFNEFYQLEFQCIYALNTKADYRNKVLNNIKNEIERLLNINARIVNSDRIPDYSESTLDIEVEMNGGWKEVASASIRTDYTNAKVFELALGIDRLVELAQK